MVDPRFSKRGAPTPEVGANLLFSKYFAEHWMKMKNWTLEGEEGRWMRIPSAPLGSAHSLSDIFTTRKRSLRRLCFHRCLSTGAGLHPGGVASRGDPHPGGYYGIRTTNGWYASSWNAFFFMFQNEYLGVGASA